MGKKVVKKKVVSSLNGSQFNLKIVTSDICDVCKTPCSRGIRYREFMKIPGSVGRGIPCILTRGRKLQ
jgi:hypothetical protein